MMCLSWEPQRTCGTGDCKGLWFWLALATTLFVGGKQGAKKGRVAK